MLYKYYYITTIMLLMHMLRQLYFYAAILHLIAFIISLLSYPFMDFISSLIVHYHDT